MRKIYISLILLMLLLMQSPCYAVIGSGCIWEFRTTGNSANGGGFVSGASGTDYSQQTSPQHTFTDIVINATTNTLITSSAYPFGSDDVGNILNITSGTGFTVGRYQIVSVDGSNVATVDRAIGTVGSTGGNGRLGGCVYQIANLGWGTTGVQPGHILYIQNGDYTYTSSMDVRSTDGTILLPITIEGYYSTRGDNPVGENRPNVSYGGEYSLLGSYMVIKNIIWTGTSGYSYFAAWEEHSVTMNCKGTNTSTSTDRPGVRASNYGGYAINCEGISTNGFGMDGGYGSQYYKDCYAHDSAVGFYIGTGSGYSNIMDNCISDNNVRGIGSTGLNNNRVLRSTITNNDYGSYSTTGFEHLFVDTIFAYNDVGIYTTTGSVFSEGCVFYGNALTGTDNSGTSNKATSIVDTTENFIYSGVAIGKIITNVTDNSTGTITSITTTTNTNDTLNFSAGLSGGTDNDFDNGDSYSIADTNYTSVNAHNQRNVITIDPSFVNLAGEDFRVGSNMAGANYPTSWGNMGANSSCVGYTDKGAVQRVETSGTGGGIIIIEED